jgi:hypothetical protein
MGTAIDASNHVLFPNRSAWLAAFGHGGVDLEDVVVACCRGGSFRRRKEGITIVMVAACYE